VGRTEDEKNAGARTNRPQSLALAALPHLDIGAALRRRRRRVRLRALDDLRLMLDGRALGVAGLGARLALGRTRRLELLDARARLAVARLVILVDDVCLAQRDQRELSALRADSAHLVDNVAVLVRLRSGPEDNARAAKTVADMRQRG